MWPTKHFTADDLDAFHSGALSNEMRLHLETCEECRRLVGTDRQLLALLSQLGSFGPREGFESRVMHRVAIAGPVEIPVLSFPKLGGRRLAALVALAAGLVASVGWSAAHRPLLERALDRIGTDLFAAGSSWLQGAAATLSAQPWYLTLAETWGSPVRLAVTVVVVLAVYSLGLVALRRLITPSVDGVSNANA